MEDLVPIGKMKPTGLPYGTGMLGVGSVPIEENGETIHYCRNYHRWDAEAEKWVLVTVYDDMNHEWVDITHIKQ